MGDRHGGRFARRGRTLSPPRRGFPMARCGFPMARGGGQDLPRAETLPRRRPPDTAHERKNLPAQERSPRRRPPDTAHERRDLSRAGTRPAAKASRHGAKAKEFVPTREHAPRRRPPDTAHERKNLPRAETRSSAKASRHGARAKGFAPQGSRSLHVPTNGRPPSTDGQPEKHPFGGVAPETARPLPSSFTEKK